MAKKLGRGEQFNWRLPLYVAVGGCIVLLSLMVLADTACAQQLVPEPEGYRTEDYRSPVPETLAGARVFTTAEAEAIWRAKTAVFVDVLPRRTRPCTS